MHNPVKYRKYAEECERLARVLPEHKESLLKIAIGWRQCAEEAERHDNEPKKLSARWGMVQ
jgi:hypothetical protein